MAACSTFEVDGEGFEVAGPVAGRVEDQVAGGVVRAEGRKGPGNARDGVGGVGGPGHRVAPVSFGTSHKPAPPCRITWS